MAEENTEQLNKKNENKPVRELVSKIGSVCDNNNDLVGKATVYENLDQKIIIIPEDRAKLHLIDYRDALISQRAWIAPLTTGASLLVATISVDNFKNKFGISPDTWSAMINISLALSVVWLLITCFNMYKDWRKGGIDSVIAHLESSSPNLETKKNLWLTIQEKFLKT